MTDRLNPRTLFIIDAFGASLSAFMLGVVLMRLEHVFGMPRQALVVLTALPVVFVIYDVFCLVTRRTERSRYLFFIGMLNACYCCVSIGYVLLHAESLTTLGWLYFAGEIVLVLGLAIVELRAARRG